MEAPNVPLQAHANMAHWGAQAIKGPERDWIIRRVKPPIISLRALRKLTGSQSILATKIQ